MSGDASDSRKTEVGDAGLLVPVDQDIRLRRQVRYVQK